MEDVRFLLQVAVQQSVLVVLLVEVQLVLLPLRGALDLTVSSGTKAEKTLEQNGTIMGSSNMEITKSNTEQNSTIILGIQELS